ncbi:MAG: 3-oxoacyl-[acyl-carrier-protein] synthase III C-terminal domain-containing protein, partial [Myxococcota bacterium]
VGSDFKVVLSPDVPKLVAEEIPGEVDELMDGAGMKGQRPDFVVAHPGGPKVLEALQDALDLEQKDLQLSWDCLQAYGNMSSASVLFILEDTINNPPPPGSVGVMAALGPGFCAELNLLKRAA